ncbi:MAG: hypothetical protein JW956_02530 [Calditrichaceae bacterium]|nr:hypothetical protein [Calditrichaceae bacterium]
MHFIKIKFIITFIMIACISVTTAQDKQPDPGPKFTEVADNLDLSKHSAREVMNYWKKVNGKQVTWTGTVKEAKAGRGKAQIMVANDKRKLSNGYNIVLITYDLEAAGNLKLNQSISFTGTLYDYKGRKGNPVIIYLDEVVLVK